MFLFDHKVVQRMGPDVLEISLSQAAQCDGAIFRDFHEQQLGGSVAGFWFCEKRPFCVQDLYILRFWGYWKVRDGKVDDMCVYIDTYMLYTV